MWYKLAFECFCRYIQCCFWSWKWYLYAKIARILWRLGEWCVENSEEDYARRPTLIEQTTEAWEMHEKAIEYSMAWDRLAKIAYTHIKRAFACR